MQISPILISLKTAILATIITFFLGIMAARFVLKLKRFRGVIDAIITLPMVIPPTVVGFFLLVILGTGGPLGFLKDYGINIIFNYPANVIAAVVVSFPLMYRTALGAFSSVEEELIMVARTLKFSERKIFYRIMLPLSKEGLFSGMILSFARSLGEFGATMMIAGNIENKTRSISTAIYSAVQAGRRDLAYQWAMVVVLISLVSMIIMNWVNSHDRVKN